MADQRRASAMASPKVSASNQKKLATVTRKRFGVVRVNGPSISDVNVKGTLTRPHTARLELSPPVPEDFAFHSNGLRFPWAR
jgi:hypothetical protein